MTIADTPIFRDQMRAYAGLPHGNQLVDLEAAIGAGLALYQSLQQMDEKWGDAVREGNAEFSESEVRAIGHLYEQWVGPCDDLLARIDKFEARNCEVAGALKFRDACNHVRGLLSIPVDRVLTAAHQSNRPGRSIQELRDELRSRV